MRPTHDLHVNSDVTLMSLLEDLNHAGCSYLVHPVRAGETFVVTVDEDGLKVAKSQFMFIVPTVIPASESAAPQSAAD